MGSCDDYLINHLTSQSPENIYNLYFVLDIALALESVPIANYIHREYGLESLLECI